MSRFLLTGGTGTLGTELQKHLDCFAPTSEELDVREFNKDIGIYFFTDEYNEELANIDTLVHCAAWTDVPGAENNKSDVVQSNIIGAHNMASYAHRNGWKFVYISTDYVYGGVRGNYTEEDITRPFNFYGFSKLAGEAFANLEKDLIIRTSFKPNDLWNTKYDKAFVDLYTSADYADVIANDIALVVDSDLTGIINVGTERKSVYELASRRNPKVGKLSKTDLADFVELPGDISMNIDRFLEFKRARGGSQ